MARVILQAFRCSAAAAVDPPRSGPSDAAVHPARSGHSARVDCARSGTSADGMDPPRRGHSAAAGVESESTAFVYVYKAAASPSCTASRV